MKKDAEGAPIPIPEFQNRTPHSPTRQGRKSNHRYLRIERICVVCGNHFLSRTSTARYCSHKCNQTDYYRLNKKKAAPSKSNRIVHNKASCSISQATNNNASVPDKDLLTVQEFATRLGVCKQTVYNMSTASQVRIIRFTKRLSYISWSEFEATTKGHAVPSQYTAPRSAETNISGSAMPQTSIRKQEQPSARQHSEPAGILTSAWTQTYTSAPERPRKESPTVPPVPTTQPQRAELASVSDEWIDCDAACQRYGILKNTLYSMIHYHKIPSKRKNKRSLYSVAAMDKVRRKTVPEEGYISVQEAAAKYSVSISMIYRRLGANNIPHIKRQGVMMFHESAFAKTLKHHKSA